jgi:hypothetical protein
MSPVTFRPTLPADTNPSKRASRPVWIAASTASHRKRVSGETGGNTRDVQPCVIDALDVATVRGGAWRLGG